MLSLLFLIVVNYFVTFARGSQYIISGVRRLKINLRLYKTQISWSNLLIILLVISITSLFLALIPPLQSPDESDHITRAYLLSKGKIILDAPAGNNSGGMIAPDLTTYFAAYEVLPFKKDRKLAAGEIDSAKIISRYSWI